jgi:hypothetical protein
MYWTCLYGVHAKYVGFSYNISGFCLRGSHFEAQPQRLYSKLLFVVFLSTISPCTGESHCYFIIVFRFKNFLQLAADVASLNIVQILDTQVTVMQYLAFCELLIYVLERHLSHRVSSRVKGCICRGCLMIVICQSLRVTAPSVSDEICKSTQSVDKSHLF